MAITKRKEELIKNIKSLLPNYSFSDNTIICVALEHEVNKLNKEKLSKEILKYEFDEIRRCLVYLDFPVDFEYYQDELKTYRLEDMDEVLTALKNGEGLE